MPSTYKDLVETLFRGKHIKIVVATNTLAMGINMPCRTAMFAGNDKLITPLLFRQMQGRAGRRGYDDVGHVVFFGFEPRTASRLLTSRLENLAGHYSISNTLVLRFLNLYHFSKDKGAVVKKFNNLLLRPYMAAGLSEAGKAAFTSQLQHHLRFAVEYCVQRGVADTAGAPVGLAQLVPHTHTHPSVLIHTCNDDSNPFNDGLGDCGMGLKCGGFSCALGPTLGLSPRAG
jgi:hypothetical protein